MKYDVAVIGAGPAGLMAAARAAELGARVILIEKNPKPGVKLLLTGGGRCNITNMISEAKLLSQAYGAEGKFLLSAFSKFGPESVADFFQSRGVRTKVEDHNRVFPLSDRAQDVLDVLQKQLKRSGVELKTQAEVREFAIEENRIIKIILLGGEEILADEFILATGGKSYPSTGSSGDGFHWLQKFGHTLTDIYPALAPIYVKEKYVAELQGLSLKNAQVSLYSKNKKIMSGNGEMIFTRNGLSGPLAMDLSRTIARALPDKIFIKIDFEPGKNAVELDEALLGFFRDNSNKAIKNSLSKFLPPKLSPIILRLCRIDAEKQVNSVTKAERKALISLLKDFSLEIDAIGGYDQAMVTSGGINLKEVDQKTMRSKLVKNLYIAGELLGIDGPTGGYNLQVCWSSGYVAGGSAAGNG